MWNSQTASFDAYAMLQPEFGSFPGSPTSFRQYLWLSSYHLQQALHFAVRAYIECSFGTNHEDDKSTIKHARLVVREEVLKLLWPHANADRPNKLDAMLIAEVTAHRLPKSKEDELLAQLSNGQKKMCEQKFHSFIHSRLFDNLVKRQLPAYLKAVQENPSKLSAAREEILRKLRHAPSFLTEVKSAHGTTEPPKQDCVSQAEPPAGFGMDIRTSELCSAAMQSEQNTSSDEAPVSVPPLSKGWQVKNTFIDVCEEMQEDPMQVRDTKSCLAGCWSHHAQQKDVLPGRAGSVGEVASHWEAQSVSKWDYGDWTRKQKEFKLAPREQPSMSSALLNVFIDALNDRSQNAAELALHISANVQVLDTNMKTKAIENLKACLRRAKDGEDCEVVLKALAACTMLEFLDHTMVHDRTCMQYVKVAEIFSGHLSAEQLSLQQLPKLIQIVTLHLPVQNEAASIIVDICVTKILEVHQDRGVILGVDVSTGQAARLLDEERVWIAKLFGEVSASKHWRSCVRLFVRMYPLPEVVELLLASDRPGDAWELALEEIIGGFDCVASILLDTRNNHTQVEKDSARKIISEALQHDLAKQSVDLHKWICKSVSPLRRFEMRKRFFIFGLLLGEADLWQLVEGSFRHSNGPQEDMLSVALSIIQDLVPFRRGLCSSRVASQRVEILLKIESPTFQQYGHAFDSNLAQCLGVLVNDLGELINDLPGRICEKLVSLMAEKSDAGVLHACSWALSQLLSKWSITDEGLRLKVRQQCCAIQDLYVSEVQAVDESTKILKNIACAKADRMLS